jgi:tetratricopeptide (TPR) repeat protein
VSEQSIEEFIDGDLEGELLEEFVAEMLVNTDLKAEVSLRKNINKAVAEQEIMSLRGKLQQVKEDAGTKEIKSIILNTDSNSMKWWRVGVAVAVLLFAITGIVNTEFGSMDKTFNKYYTSAEWSPERAVTSDLNFLQQANNFRATGEYEKAIDLYNQAINEVNETYPYRFWKATLLQDIGKYREAISEYTQVINQGDNTFIEEAEWYKSYCYLKLEEWDEAKEQLLAIIEKKGYFENDAKAILRRLRYSFK